MSDLLRRLFGMQQDAAAALRPDYELYLKRLADGERLEPGEFTILNNLLAELKLTDRNLTSDVQALAELPALEQSIRGQSSDAYYETIAGAKQGLEQALEQARQHRATIAQQSALLRAFGQATARIEAIKKRFASLFPPPEPAPARKRKSR